MKSFRPQAEAAQPEDEGPGEPPVRRTARAPNRRRCPAHQIRDAPDAQPETQHPQCRGRFRGERRLNATHASTTDPDARLYKTSPGTGAMLCFIGGGGSENGPGDRFPDDGAHGKPERADRSGRPHGGHKHRKRIDLRRQNDPQDRFLILLTIGWAKTIGGTAQTVLRGIERVRSRFILTWAAGNLARLPKLPGV